MFILEVWEQYIESDGPLIQRYLRVPVLFGDPVQATKHDGKDLVNVFLDEAENVLVIPEVQRSLRDLPRQKGMKNCCSRVAVVLLHDPFPFQSLKLTEGEDTRPSCQT